MITYLATIHKDDYSDYGVQFYDFPGCISVGKTIEESKIMAAEALNGHLHLMLTDGEEIPQPSNLETILTDSDHQDAVAFIIVEVSENILTNRELCMSN